MMKATLLSGVPDPAEVVVADDRVVGFDSHLARRKLVDDELRSSREQLAIAQRIGRIGTWEYDVARKRRSASDELYRIFDLDPAVGADLGPFDARIHPDDYPNVCAARVYIAGQHQPIAGDMRIVLGGGEVRTLHAQVGYVHDEEGNLLKVTGVVQDVTEARAMQNELARRAVQQAAVANLGQAALGGASMQELARLTSTIITEVLDVDLCVILEATSTGFRVVQGTDFVATLRELDVTNASHAAYALRTNASVIVNDLRAETRFVPSPLLLRKGVVSSVTVPVSTDDGTWGTLAAHSRTRRRFTSGDVDFLRGVASMLGQVVMRARTDHALRIRARQQSAISELSRRALKSVDDAVLARAREIVVECLEVDEATFTEVAAAPPPRFERGVMEVLVSGPGTCYGVLAAKSHAERQFTHAEVEFLQALANILAEGIERERAARALAASELRYREVVEGATEAIFTLSMDGKFTSLNAAFEGVTGFPAHEWVGKPYLDLIHPDERLHSREVFRAVVERQESVTDELTVIRKDGIGTIALTSFPKVENGRTTAIYGFARDITEARRDERERQQLTRNLQLLLESTLDGILTFDLEGRCTMYNRAAAAILGRTPEEIIGGNVHALLRAKHEDGMRCDACAILDVATSGDVHSAATETFWRADGTPIPVEYSAAPVVDDGVSIGVVVSFTDISERLLLEAKLEQANRLSSLGRLAATIAHEFNNVLMGIAPFVEVIRRGKDVSTAVDHISRTIKRGKRVTEDILRFTQPAEPVRTAIELAPWLQSVTLEARSLLADRCDLEVSLDDPSLRVDGDAAQLQQIFSNLILNARDAMPEGGALRISIGRETTPDPRLPWGVLRHPERYAHFVVSDTGCGMSADTLRHIFEPLYTTKKNGTGLGLSVVHQVVMRHAGEIFVESAPGAGTAFHIFLPLAAAPETRATAIAAAPAWIAPPASRILLVEDDECVAQGLQSVLSLEGIDVVIAGTGGDAICAIVTDEFDLVVLDVGLPDMEGTNVYSAIAGMRPELPVIFSTGHGDRSKLELATARANVGFLLKPYDCDMLLATMREVTRGSGAAGSQPAVA